MAACDSAPSRSKRPAPQRSTSAASSASPALLAASTDLSWQPPAPRALGAEAERVLARQRNGTLRFAPTPEPVRRLVFFGRNLARLTRDALYVISLDSPHSSSAPGAPHRVPLDGPRELARLADGSLLVVARTSTEVYAPSGQRSETLGKVTLFPPLRLLPELRWPKAFFTLDVESGVLASYRFGALENDAPGTQPSILLPKSTLEQPELAQACCTLLEDGSYVCLGPTGLLRGWPGHVARRLGTVEAGATVVRLLPDERAERVRLLRSDGRLESYWVLTKPKRLSTVTLPWMPFDLVARKGAIFVVTLDQTQRQARTFRLISLNAAGKERWTTPLDTVSADSAPGDFDRNLGDCRSLALHPTEPWLAVSDCGRISILDAESGALSAKIEGVPF